jgi:hypothetical protein
MRATPEGLCEEIEDCDAEDVEEELAVLEPDDDSCLAEVVGGGDLISASPGAPAAQAGRRLSGARRLRASGRRRGRSRHSGYEGRLWFDEANGAGCDMLNRNSFINSGISFKGMSGPQMISFVAPAIETTFEAFFAPHIEGRWRRS